MLPDAEIVMGEVEENSRENSAEKDSKPIEVGQIFGGLLFDLASRQFVR